jgi:hypothetical protein
MNLTRPKDIESLLINANRKLKLEAVNTANSDLEIIIGTELFVDICQRIIQLEKELERITP